MLCLLLIWGCDKSKEEVQKAKDSVMAAHDDAMAKMEKMHELQNKLKALIAQKTVAENADTPERSASLDAEVKIQEVNLDSAKIQQLILALGDADKAMMDWMKQYEDPSEDMSAEEQKKYFAEQQKLIDKVVEMTNSSIANSEDLLKATESKPE